MKEVWKDIKGYEGLYRISNYGNVFNIIKNNLQNKYLKGRGVYYNVVSLNKNKHNTQFLVHRLVLMHFGRMPLPGEESNHIDFNPLNNRIDNLEWVTSSQNSLHSREHMSKAKQGEKHPLSKVTDQQAVEIKRLRKQKVRHRKIAEMFDITIQDSMNIATRYYSHIDHLV